MNLYKVNILTGAPKNSWETIDCFLLAENDESIYEYIKIKQCWDEDKEKEPMDIYDEQYNIIGKETFKEHIIRLKGDYNDEDEINWGDAYYGVTAYSWECIGKTTKEEIDVLRKFNIILEEQRTTCLVK